MLSEQSKRNLDNAFQRALQTYLVRTPEDVCSITPADSDKFGEQPDASLQVITISSFAFRLLTLFRLSADPATRAYYDSGGGKESLDQAFSEIANLCCGALSRELAQDVKHLAMSIPYTLSSQCLAFVDELRPDYLSTCAVSINDTVQLQVSLCMCCSGPVEFSAGAVAVELGGGELEMF